MDFDSLHNNIEFIIDSDPNEQIEIDEQLQLMIIKEYVQSLELKILNNHKNKKNPLLLFAFLNSFKNSLCL